MINNKIAIRYAKALFNLTGSNEDLEVYLSNLKLVADLLTKHPQLMHFFISPQIDINRKKKTLESSLSTYVNPPVIKLLDFLLDKRRFQYLPGIVKEFEKLVREKLGIIDVRLITPTQTESELKEKLQRKLENLYKKKVNMILETDPSLLGGGILVIENKMIDFSIRGKLNQLKQDLLK